MNQLFFILLLLFVINPLFGQIDELNSLRNDAYNLIQYDLQKDENKDIQKLEFYQSRFDKSFLAFVKNKNTNSVEQILGITNFPVGTRTIGNYTYSFHSLKLNNQVASDINNRYSIITFYGVYNYKLSHFVSIFIQPFTLNKKEYTVYYCGLNNKGKYYIKENKKNRIVYSDVTFASFVPIRGIYSISPNNSLVVESLGDLGVRAIVLDTQKSNWFATNSFKNQLNDSTENRKYLTLETNRDVYSSMKNFYSDYEIKLDEANQTIFYHKFDKDNPKNPIKIEAKWIDDSFRIDDYSLIGEYPTPRKFSL